MSEEQSSIVWLVIIAGRNQKDDLLVKLSEMGGHLINTLYGKGSVRASFLEDMFGLVPEENKVVITSLVRTEKSREVIDTLIADFDFNAPNTGIAFTMPIDKVNF